MAVTWVAFHLTDRCQLDCQHCLRDPAQKPKDLPLAIFRKVLAEARALYRTRQVALTGGEPTLHPELEGVLDAIVEQDYTWHLVTNGKRFEHLLALLRDDPARRERLTAVNLSLDGADEATHDGIRAKGSFREVMKAVTLCEAHGIPFVLQMTLNARNVHQIEAFGLMAAQLGAARASFSMLQATGTHHDKALFMPARAWAAAQDRIERLARALTLPVSMPEGFPKEQPFHVCEPFKSEQLHVDVEGRLNLCCQHAGVPSEGPPRDVAADLGETSLAEGHRRLLGIIHETQAAKLEAMTRGELDAWDHFPCNWCMKHFAKPHWTEEGAGGPEAQRERWRGAWAPKVSLPVVR
ncbi:radical SAM protein [Polyangium aurulentum]|uniref:radical SAM protein n=1 Tax=Polyangium aurulentum TaxID=2567896 RepID=UPI0010AE2457|nr:radical SAM protein [Polyangium aurulentum]UQA55310.1 radical SAM protein [Polyangium aurulentum]